MKLRIVIVLVVTAFHGVAAAEETGKYQCSYGDMQRRIEIASEPGVEVPCSVLYFKDTEMPGEQQELWSADSDPAYCSSKAMELVAKLEGWGWECERGIEAAADQETVDEMDTAEPEEMLGDPDPDPDADANPDAGEETESQQ